jgi:hypothetical protein
VTVQLAALTRPVQLAVVRGGPKGDTGPAGGPWRFEDFTPTNGQVTFILANTPADAGSVVFEVNGVDYHQDDAFTVSGTTVTWLAPWAMQTTDFVTVRYQ